MNPLRTTHGPARGFCFSDTDDIKTNPEAFCTSFGDIFYEKSVHSGFSNFPVDVLHDLLGSRNSAFTDVIYGVFGVFAGFRDRCFDLASYFCFGYSVFYSYFL